MSLSSSFKRDNNELATYKSFRQFPHLHTSMREISAFLGHTTPIQFQQNRNSIFKSTNKMKELTKSVLPEIHYLNDFKNEVLTSHSRNKYLDPIKVASKIDNPDIKDPLLSAKSKLTKFSLSYNSRSEFPLMAGFADKYMTRDYFKAQIKTCLHIHLSPSEENSLFDHFQPRENDTIDGIHFVRFLIRLGNEERKRLRIELQEKSSRRLKQENNAKISENEKYIRIIFDIFHSFNRMAKQELLQISYDYSNEDKKNVINYLNQAALRFEEASDVSKLGFGSFLRPIEFILQIEKTLQLKLNPRESGALIDYFRDEDQVYIDGVTFCKKFGRIRSEAWQRHHRTQRDLALKALKLRELGQNVDNYFPVLGR